MAYLVTQRVYYFTDSTGFGGAELVLLALMGGLDPGRWKPTLVFHASEGITPLVTAGRELGIPLWEVPSMPLGAVGARRVAGFARRLRARRPAVFHANLTWPLSCKFGLAAAVLARIPAVFATQHLFFDFPLDVPTRLQQRLLAVGVDRYIAVSWDTAERLRRAFGWPGRKLEVIQPAIDPGRFGNAPDAGLRAALSGEEERPIVLTVARLEPQKGLSYLIESAKDVPRARFLIAGDGPERSALEEQVERLDLRDRVELLGARTDIPELMACCDVFVLSSLYEGLPLVVLEAMASGKPVVATRVGGTAEAVAHGETGILVPPADPAALACAVNAVLSDHELARRLGEAGREAVGREFSIPRLVGETTRLYERVLSGA